MTSFDTVAGDSVAPERLHAAFTAAFADYLLGPFQVAPAQWPQFLARQGIALPESRVALDGEDVLAFCLVAPRPETASWRLGTMGALPAARGSGAAPALLDDFVARAAARGIAAIELECFAQNTRALRLYEGRGFRVVDELHGWRRDGDAVPVREVAAVQPVDLDAAFAWIEAAQADGCELPLQVTPRSLRALPVALQAWQHADAQLVFSRAEDGRLTIHALVDRAPAQAAAFALLSALLAQHPGAALSVPQLQRPVLGGDALARIGCERLPLHQLWMRRPARP